MSLRPDLFLGAQAAMGPIARYELRARRKHCHWIWFVFPQHRALGHSANAELFGLDLADAREYLRHPALRDELVACCRVVADRRYRRPVDLGADAVKLGSSMTLFEEAAYEEGLNGLATLFARALAAQDLGRCEATLALIDAERAVC